MIIHDIEQGTPEWFSLRLGKLTGSRAKDMLATIKTGEAAARRDYRLELVCERLTSRVLNEDAFVSKDMQRGNDIEPLARSRYEAVTGHWVRSTGFVSHDTLPAGCSLDGDVDDMAGLIELKCPKSATHLRYIRSGSLPSEHIAQVTHNLWITGAQWADFVSFDDRFPRELQLFIVRVSRADLDIAGYQRAALAFLGEVEREVEDVKKLMRSAA